jgi:hypothetical protein
MSEKAAHAKIAVSIAISTASVGGLRRDTDLKRMDACRKGSLVAWMKNMLISILNKNKSLITDEAQLLSDFMFLIMKQKNTGLAWTKEEKRRLRSHLKHLSLYIPVLFIFSLPGGSLLFPVLASVLDRRKQRRIQSDISAGKECDFILDNAADTK